jgi:hypothetical protein
MEVKKFKQFNEDHSVLTTQDHSVSDRDTTNYMFFENLKTLHRLATELLSIDKDGVDSVIENGHDWIGDHISVAKANVEHVYGFLMNKEALTDNPIETQP